MDDQSKLRKYENLLAISGAGVIAFGLWSVVKAVIYLLVLSPQQLVSNMAKEGLTDVDMMGLSQTTASIIAICGVIIALLIDLSLRFYVGRSAIIDGRRQKKKSVVYVIMAILLSMGLISSTITRFTSPQTGAAQTWDTVVSAADASIFIDLTSLLAFIEMIVAAIMVRRLRKELGKDDREVM